MKSLKYYFRQIKKFPGWIYFIPALLIKILKLTMRSEVNDPHKCADVNRFPFITVIWHNRLLFLATVFSRDILEKSMAVVSASRDGQYLVDLLAQFRVGSIRGSSSKRGNVVIREALKAIEDKKNVVITPDGPRGPKYKMSLGPVQLASMTETPIVPISINARSYWQLNSWDNFQIPKPGTKLILEIGEPITVPKDLNDEDFEKYRQLVENKLLAVTRDQ